MIEIGGIYYLSDQFGCKFIRIVKTGDIWDKNDPWAYYLQSTSLNDIIYSDLNKGYLKGNSHTSQMKIVHLEKLLTNYSFRGRFKGCIKIEDSIINLVKNQIGQVSLPYIECIDDNFICKEISKEEYRNFILDKIL